MSTRYLNSLLSLMPDGLFDPNYSVNLRNFLSSFAGEFQNVEDYIKESYDNIFPENADDDFLTKWSLLTGANAENRAQQRLVINRQMRKSGGAAIDSFTSHLRDLGIDDSPDRIIPILDPFTCNSECDDYLWSDASSHAFGIRLPIDQQFFTCNSECDRGLIENQSDEVLDYLRGAAPAHATVVFFYDQTAA